MTLAISASGSLGQTGFSQQVVASVTYGVPFKDTTVLTPQTTYVTSTSSAGTPTFFVSVSDYTF